jgi:hypothetical protein
MMRGGDYMHRAAFARSSFRNNGSRNAVQTWNGVRPARKVDGEIVRDR